MHADGGGPSRMTRTACLFLLPYPCDGFENIFDSGVAHLAFRSLLLCVAVTVPSQKFGLRGVVPGLQVEGRTRQPTMFLAGTSARNAAVAVGRTPGVAAALIRRSQAPRTTHGPTSRLSTVPPRRGRGGRRGRGVAGREAGAQASERSMRARQNEDVPRFQQFGRAGGEGERVAERLFREFGVSGTREFSPEAAEERKSVLKWLEGELKMSSRAIAGMVEQEPRVADQQTEALSVRLAWLKSRLRMSDEQIRSLVHRRPSVLCRSVQDGMEAKVRRSGICMRWRVPRTGDSAVRRLP